MGWMRATKQVLNPDKTAGLLVSQMFDPVAGISPGLDGVALPLKVRL